MNRNYIILTALMTILAFGTIFIAKDKEPNQIDPQQLLSEIVQPTRYVTTDQVAKMIISKDPSLLLLDVRDVESFSKYALPNAVNLPVDSMMNADYLSNLGVTGTKAVFYSNDDIKADQAWVLAKRLGYKSIYVMKGGVNNWMETIINPAEPSGDEPYSAIETYTFRKGASQFFTGAKTESSESSKVEVKVEKRAKSNAAKGGC